MAYVLVNWLLSALTLMIVANFLPGFRVASFSTALIASVVIGLVNSTLGALLKILTFPLTIVTFGLFLFVINALMLRMVSAVVPGFAVDGFGAALLGAIAVSVLNTVLRHLVFS